MDVTGDNWQEHRVYMYIGTWEVELGLEGVTTVKRRCLLKPDALEWSDNSQRSGTVGR